MNSASEWQVPKWPFLLAGFLLLLTAWGIESFAEHPITWGIAALITLCAAVGAALGCLPFILEYRATKRLLEVHAVTTVAGRLDDLGQYAAQIAEVSEQWTRLRESSQGDAGKTVAAAQDVVGRMAEVIRKFDEFQTRSTNSEREALRLEVDKLRRAEGEWLQVLARILDHIFALHTAAARSGQLEVAEQINHFQHACHDTARRVGLALFTAAPGEKLDAERHRVHGVENQPLEGVVAETLAPGFTYQGRLIRHAFVRLEEPPAPLSVPETPPAPAAVEEPSAEMPSAGEPQPEPSETVEPAAEPTAEPDSTETVRPDELPL